LIYAAAVKSSGFPYPQSFSFSATSATLVHQTTTMKDYHEPSPGSEDDLRAENEVLKLKLEMDHGMKGFGSVLSPQAENEWLKSVYEFEGILKESNGLTIFDLIGRPQLKRWYTLKMEKVTIELRSILTLLAKNGITLQNLNGLDDMASYRVITEEFLPMKLGDFANGPFTPPVITWFGKEKKT